MRQRYGDDLVERLPLGALGAVAGTSVDLLAPPAAISDKMHSVHDVRVDPAPVTTSPPWWW
jgi:hypothetical protein